MGQKHFYRFVWMSSVHVMNGELSMMVSSLKGLGLGYDWVEDINYIGGTNN